MSNPKRIHWSWTNIEVASIYIKSRLDFDGFKPDYIVGLTRGGLIPAVLLSHMMGVKLQTLNVSLRDSEEGPESNLWLPEVATVENKKILIVDDINDSGATFEWIKKDWDSSELPNGCKWDNIKFATLVHNEASVTKTDYSFTKIDKSKEDVWIVFPWEKND